MDFSNDPDAALGPLPYHTEVVAYLKAHEPEVWAWASSFDVQAQHAADMRAGLLRETYRLTPEGHPDIYQRCATVMGTLGIEAPSTLYQAGSQGMNAALFFLRGEIHLVLHGPVLERLSPEELTALLGHELAHYRLWSIQGGDFHTAARILDQALADAGAAPSHVQTARLYGLYTEAYADRGAAFVTGAAGPAISTLVKVQTGSATVDVAGYLRQAEELERTEGLSQAGSHPETYVRAQALEKWVQGDATADAWLKAKLKGPLSMARLDLLDQRELTGLTRRSTAAFLADETLRSDEVLTQVRRYFPDWRPTEEAVDFAALAPDQIDDSVRDYLSFVLLDLALADADLQDQALLLAARAADALGRRAAFLEALKRDVRLPRRQLDALTRALKAAA